MPANTSQAVLITGGAGFIGANLAAALVRTGHRVSVLDDLSAGDAANLQGVDAPLVTGSVLDIPLVDRLVTEHDAVVHLAGATAVPTPLATRWVLTHVNTTGTLNVLESPRHAGSHVPLASSAVYGSPTQMPVGRTCRSDRQVPTASVAHPGLRRGDPLRRSLAGLRRHASARESIHCQMYPLWTKYTQESGMEAVTTRFPQWLRDAIDRQTPGQRRSDALRQVVIEGVTSRDFPMVVWRDGPSGRRPGLRGGPDIEEIVAVANLYNKDVSLADVAAEVGVSEQDVADALRFRVAYGEIMDDRLAIRHRALALAVRQD